MVVVYYWYIYHSRSSSFGRTDRLMTKAQLIEAFDADLGEFLLEKDRTRQEELVAAMILRFGTEVQGLKLGTLLD